jgi:2-polyprenyl-6-hydroxyphenyl methylase/3-demethylubiquinone-9 3-methyltransferase
MSNSLNNLPNDIINDKSWHSHYEALQNNFNYWQSKGYLLSSDLREANVLDFGGSAGQLAVIALQNGAKRATVIDTELPVTLYETKLQAIEALSYSTLTVEAYCEEVCQAEPLGGEVQDRCDKFELVLAHTVTEHLQYPASVFAAIYKLLKPGGLFFVVHDNYYHPSGAHDNAMLTMNSRYLYEYQGPKCWDSQNKCDASRAFRKDMSTRFPWAWDAESDNMLCPEDCEDCLFFKRTQPWAHILYQPTFKKVFPAPGFSSGHDNSVLNKITPFQLKQFLIEAGFEIELWDRGLHNNPLPAELLEEPYCCSEYDLKTLNLFARCRKSAS